MFNIYILLSQKSPRTYVGYSQDLARRIQEHNSGKVAATKYFRPWKLIYTEEVISADFAKYREKYWKTGAGRRNIKKIIEGSRPSFIKKMGEARSN